MIKPLQLFSVILIILFGSCQREISDLEFEKNVMTEIFPDLIDSICLDSRIFFVRPLIYGKIIRDKEGNYIDVDTTKVTIAQKKEKIAWEKKIAAIEKDTSKIIFAFDPVIKRNTDDVNEDFEKYVKGSKIYTPKKVSDSTYTIDFKNIKLINPRFELRNDSEFPKGREIWKTKYDFNFSGIVSFSGIQFDKDKKFGILDGGFMCGRLNGSGFRIYIKKVNDKWIIDKIDNTSGS